MKKIIQIQVFALFIGSLSYISAQNAAPSSHMRANDTGSGDIVMKTVRSTITTSKTYFSTMGWNTGAEGGGYSGFQDSPDGGHLFIFSIWDPSNGQTITTAYTGAGTVAQNFGGEGTGLKSTNTTIGWSLNEWNTVVTRRWDVGSHTHFGFWIRRGNQNKWYHMITMDYPVANVTFNGTTYAFLEDWGSTGANKRRFEMKDAFKRKTNGTWQGMTQGAFTRNDEARSSNYTNANDAGTLSGGGYFIQTGGNTTPSYSGTPPITFNNSAASAPSNPTIGFSISSATTTSVTWSVPTSSTPQFKYTIKVNGNQVASAINSEVRNKAISASGGSTVEVILEDILGRTSSKTTTIAGGSGGGGGSGSGGELTSGVTVNESLSSSAPSDMWYIDIGANATSLNVILEGVSGTDFDLYGKFNSEPTTSSYDWRGYTGGNENSTTSNPAQGRHYIMPNRYSGDGNYTLKATVTYSSGGGGGGSGGGGGGGSGSGGELTSGVTVNESLSSSAPSDMWYIDIGANATSLNVILDGVSGTDFDSYGKFNSEPTTSSYDWRGYTGGDENNTISNPAQGRHYIMASRYSGDGNYTLKATVTYSSGGGGGGGSGSGNELTSGVIANESLSSSAPSDMWYIDIGANATSLNVILDGVSGTDFDSYGKFNSEPTTSSYDWRGYTGGNENNTISNPAQGRHYIMANRFSGDGNYTIKATVTYSGSSRSLKPKESSKDKDDIATVSKFKVYPNPVKNELNIVFDENQKVHEVILVDITGRIIFNKSNLRNNNKLKIDLREYNLSSGFYFIFINDPNQTRTIKLLKL